jgi:site-specific DNA-methyltransferase (adenine-specific)
MLHNTTKLIHGSAEGPLDLPSASIDAVITSPPWNIGRNYYHADDNRTDKAYRAFLTRCFIESYRLLCESGLLVVGIPEFTKHNGQVTYFPYLFETLLAPIGFERVAQSAWIKLAPNGQLHIGTRWIDGVTTASTIHSISEWFLVFGKRMSTAQRYLASEIWTVQVVKDDQHPTTWPIDIARFLVSKYSLPGQTILDPFMGVGTLGCAAVEGGRHFIGVDTSSDFIRVARTRISRVQSSRDEINSVALNLHR